MVNPDFSQVESDAFQVEPFRWLNVFAQARFARSIYYDPEEPNSGRESSYSAEVSLRAGGEVCILEMDGLLNNDRFDT
jgi:hypothetical protein